MSKKITQAWNAATTVLIVLVMLLAMLIWGVKLLGMDVFVVQSGSMKPAYPVGSLVYVKETDAADLQVGDVITFNMSGNVRCTHRIVEIMSDHSSIAFRTKGDANDQPDNSLVSAKDLIGKVCFTIPYLGFLAAYIQQAPGMYVAISVIVVILLLTILPDIITKKEQGKRYEEG